MAVSALSHLLTLSLEKKAVQEKEAILLRNLIKLTGDESPGDFSKTIQHYEKARDRLQALGKEAFFGGGTVGDKEVKWFAGSAWNSGLQAAKTGDWPLCARLFACTSAFYEQLPDPSLEDLEAVKLSHLLGATASLQASESVSAEEVKSVEAELEKCKLVSAFGSQDEAS